jgi:hypothetical protein
VIQCIVKIKQSGSLQIDHRGDQTKEKKMEKEKIFGEISLDCPSDCLIRGRRTGFTVILEAVVIHEGEDEISFKDMKKKSAELGDFLADDCNFRDFFSMFMSGDNIEKIRDLLRCKKEDRHHTNAIAFLHGHHIDLENGSQLVLCIFHEFLFGSGSKLRRSMMRENDFEGPVRFLMLREKSRF